MRRDTGQVLEHADAVVALCDRYGFAYYGDWARILIGWARGQERPAEGVETIESALERLDAKRAQARRPYYLSLLAEIYGLLGNRERAASNWRARNRAAAWSSGFSLRRWRERGEHRNSLPSPLKTALYGGTLPRTFRERSAS